jgi:hypothetical protein
MGRSESFALPNPTDALDVDVSDGRPIFGGASSTSPHSYPSVFHPCFIRGQEDFLVW